jgi:hypothetical protein
MVNETDRCNGWVRQYPEIGSDVVFRNTGVGRYSNFTLKAVVGDHINVWLEEGSTALHEDVSIKAAKIYTNEYGIDELKPASDSSSWMEHECKIMGSMPFMYTCSNRINILVQECHVENAWVMSSDYLRNFPGPANADSPSNFDIVFYMCHELLDGTPNPYAAANTFAHELAHVIQGGFGSSFNAMAEGGATWLEGPLLHLAPRPMVYAWGFQDWNRINAAHFYANTKEWNSRKFYQIHAMFLTYLAQPELLGNHVTSALQNYQTFERANIPWGRSAYDYFLQILDTREKPTQFEPLTMTASSPQNAFATALLDYRVAIAAQCIVDPALRPTEAKYLMPEQLRDRPFWDCTSYQTFWSAEGDSVEGAGAQIHYGGAAVFRLAAPENATVSLAADADPRVRTKILAAGSRSSGHAAEVRELFPGSSASFTGGAREIFIVQVNVDPEGEFIGPNDRENLWHHSHYRCTGPCSGRAWRAGASKHGHHYPPDQLSALRSPVVQLPADADDLVLSFQAMWDLEDPYVDGSTVGHSCLAKGYDGVQVRVRVVGAADEAAEVVVVSPDGGYGVGPRNATAIQALGPLYGDDAPCSDFEGWTGSSGNFAWASQHFNLSQFAGKNISFELLFASDGGVGGEGFWVDKIRVTADKAQIFGGGSGEHAMKEHSFIVVPRAGDVGKHDGVPVVAALPQGYDFDRSLAKIQQTLSAPWSAQWNTPASAVDPDSSLSRAYLGWSYAAPILDTKTALLHPGQEACLRLEAPFRGSLLTATLFTLADKMGIGAVSLAIRSADAPHQLVGDGKPLISESPGVTDPGIHRFKLAGSSPVFAKAEHFFLCIGIGREHTLPADPEGSLPFLHLPLTNISTAGEKHLAGATKLIVPPAPHDEQQAFQAARPDPWHGHTFVVRAEFIAEPEVGLESRSPATMATPASGRSTGFLAWP